MHYNLIFPEKHFPENALPKFGMMIRLSDLQVFAYNILFDRTEQIVVSESRLPQKMLNQGPAITITNT